MPLIDTHLHLWDPAAQDYPWLVHVPSIAGAQLPAAYVEADADVDGAIMVQADCRDEDALAEVAWVASVGAAVPVLGMVASAPLETGEAGRDHLEALAAHPLVVGVRRSTQNEADGVIESPGYVAGMVAAARAGLAIDLCVRAHQLPHATRAVRTLVDTVPDARVVLDHAGKPPLIDGDLTAWRTALADLAAIEQVTCKISGLATEDRWDAWRPALVTDAIRASLDLFTPARSMYGSDWPVVTLASPLRHWRALFFGEIAGLTHEERDLVTSGTALATYRVAVGAATTP